MARAPPAIADSEARKVVAVLAGGPDKPRNQPQTLRAELIGSSTCIAVNITTTGSAPVLAICRELLAAGVDPDTALDVCYGTGWVQGQSTPAAQFTADANVSGNRNRHNSPRLTDDRDSYGGYGCAGSKNPPYRISVTMLSSGKRTVPYRPYPVQRLRRGSTRRTTSRPIRPTSASHLERKFATL